MSDLQIPCYPEETTTVGAIAFHPGGSVKLSIELQALCFTAEEAGSTVAMQAVGSAPAVSLEYSRDGLTWETFTVGSTVVTLTSVGDHVYLRCGSDTNNARTGSYTTIYNKFVMTGKVAASGNVNSLLSRNFDGLLIIDEFYKTHDYCYSNLFINCTSLTTAPDLTATALPAYCYYRMFYGCTALHSAPRLLPATRLNDYCYAQMFTGCTSLVETPLFPDSVTLDGYCCSRMFKGCHSLTTARIPYGDTNQQYDCYEYMFEDCVSLETSPDLGVSKASYGVYNYMFYGCERLKSVTTKFSAFDGTTNWLEGVAEYGILVCDLQHKSKRGPSGIPDKWARRGPAGDNYLRFEVNGDATVSMVAIGDAPSVNLEYSVGNGNWSPFVVGDTTVIISYSGNLYLRCSSDTPNESLAYDAANYNNFVITGDVGVSGNINSLLRRDYDNVTSLPESCYNSLFKGCTSLTRAWDIPDTPQSIDCYANMFSGCTSLSILSVNFDTWSAGTTNWVSGVTGCGNFYGPSVLPIEYGESYIPATWDNLGARSDYLCFTAEEANSTFTVQSYRSPKLEYSLDRTTWVPFNLNDVVTLTNVGDSVFLRCGSETDNTGLGTFGYGDIPVFTMTGKIAASGNVNSLLSRYFYERSTVTSSCFCNLFSGCTSLTRAPTLPATGLAEYCYAGMFRGCTSLTTAPELPATTLADSCYSSMFSGCSSLTKVSVGFTIWDTATYATTGWTFSVAPSGTFTCPASLPDTRGNSYIPEGWTIIRK